MINAGRTVVGKPDEKRPLWRHNQGWEDAIKMDLKEVDWIQLACYCEHGSEHSGSIKGGQGS